MTKGLKPQQQKALRETGQVGGGWQTIENPSLATS
jgi:hypothetical protein